MEKRLKDIIRIPEVKLVIELDDADSDPAGIISSFVITAKLLNILQNLVSKIQSRLGCGVFIKANFGSGKSHFLSYLYLLLNNRVKDWPKTLDIKDQSRIADFQLKVVKISLVKFPANRSLEKIILSSLDYSQEVENRDQTFARVLSQPTVLLIDELSEFLRSKPSSASFYEDIRFLQYLGEYSFHHPLWIIASLQEWIEETGHISSSIFNRIKDRYPMRIHLSSSHVEDIIDQRVIIKSAGAEQELQKVFDELFKFYPKLKLKFKDFYKTYPLHPYTIRFLSGLTPIFSQTRGIIHFVYSEARKILDKKTDELITPDTIFDHFEERIREIPEYSALARIVFDYYKNNVERIFDNPRHIEIALGVIKILILVEISPFEKRKNSGEIAEILLKKISSFTEEINYDLIEKGILQQLVSQKMYLIKEKDCYYIDASIDEGIQLLGKIKKIRERFEDRNYLFSQICDMIQLSYLPLKDIKEGKRYKFTWQGSSRDCIAITCAPQGLKMAEIQRIVALLEKKIDGYIIFLSPFAKDSGWISALPDALSSPFLSSILIWHPRQMETEEILFIEEYLAKTELCREYPLLKQELEKEEFQFREIITKVYFEGEILFASGGKFEDLSEIGLLPLDKFISYLLEQQLSQVHPNQYKIMPRVDYFSAYHVDNLYKYFLRQGKITVEEANNRGLSSYIQGLLIPLGIVKKRSNSFSVVFDAENELVSYLLNIISAEEDFWGILLRLKKGKWGLSEEQSFLLIGTGIALGFIVGFKDQDLVEVKELAVLREQGLDKLTIGKTLSSDLIECIPRGRFIWGEVEDLPTPITQKRMWKSAQLFIKKEKQLVSELKMFRDKYENYSIYKYIQLDLSLLNRLSLFLTSMPVSQAASPGLNRILLYLKEYPELEKEADYIERLQNFFSMDFQLLNKYFLYLNHPSLLLPADLKETHQTLLLNIQDYLKNFSCPFTTIKDQWENFFEKSTKYYRQCHEKYYKSEIFALREKLNTNEEYRVLKKITALVPTVVFASDGWEIQQLLDQLPRKCQYDLNHELFTNPVCSCGFQIKEQTPDFQDNFRQMVPDAIRNFIRTIQQNPYREKLDAYIHTMRYPSSQPQDNVPDLIAKIETLVNLNIKKTNLKLILQLLNERVLQEIEKAFRKVWEIRKIKLDDLIKKIKGKRWRYPDLTRVFFDWIGQDEESIIWIQEEQNLYVQFLYQQLKLYGKAGDKVFQRIFPEQSVDFALDNGKTIELTDGEIQEMEQALYQDGKIKYLDDLSLSSLNLDELLSRTRDIKIPYLKSKHYSEIFFRLWGKIQIKENLKKISLLGDDFVREMAAHNELCQKEKQYKEIDYFTKIIVPFNLWKEKISHKSRVEEIISENILEKIAEEYQRLFQKIENPQSRLGVLGELKNIQKIREQLEGVVVIFDGLRFDLWIMLREIFKQEGWKISEDLFQITLPSSTYHFRQSLGLKDEGEINGKSYILVKWAETSKNNKELKRILASKRDIKFIHFNFIDTKIHGSALDLYPLYLLLKDEFSVAILPLLRKIPSFYLLADHGFRDTGSIKERYVHGGQSPWEVLLPFVKVETGISLQ